MSKEGQPQRPWGTGLAAIAILLTLAAFVFDAGVQSDQIGQNAKDNEKQDEQLEKLVPAVSKIESSVEFLVRAEEERVRMERQQR